MQLSADDADMLMRKGIEALGQGRASEARTTFGQVTESGSGGERAWILLAAACGADNDRVGELRHLEAGAKRSGETRADRLVL